MLLENKICFITGAGKGIGRATAEAFLREGAVVVANDCEAGSLDDLAENPSVKILYFDVSDEPSCKKALAEINRQYERLDVLVNNAGRMKDALIGTITQDLIEELYRVNVFGTIYLLQLAAKMMMRQHTADGRGGSIINLTSIVGITGNPGQLVYSSTKGAIISLTKTAAKELGAKGIRVNAVAPGMIDTDMMRSVDEIHLQRHIDNIPCKRLGLPEEIADACLYLASDLSSYVTGHVLTVDAGVLV
jgi:3-oxoacyl-[acyl-carrier protein] reductase